MALRLHYLCCGSTLTAANVGRRRDLPCCAICTLQTPESVKAQFASGGCDKSVKIHTLEGGEWKSEELLSRDAKAHTEMVGVAQARAMAHRPCWAQLRCCCA